MSTAIVGSPKAILSTTLAVLRPTPGSASSASRVVRHLAAVLVDQRLRQRDDVLGLVAEEADGLDALAHAVLAQRHHLLAACRRSRTAPRVALLTPASVACADSTTATSSVKGLTYSSSPLGSGLAAARRAKISATRSGATLAALRPRARLTRRRGGSRSDGLSDSSGHRGFAPADRVGRMPLMTAKLRANASGAGRFPRCADTAQVAGAHRFPGADGGACGHQLRHRPRLLSGRRLAGDGLLRAGRGLGLFRLQAQLPLRTDVRDGRADPGQVRLDARAPIRAARAVRLQPLLGPRRLARVAGRAHGPAHRVPGQGAGIRPLPHRRRAPRLRLCPAGRAASTPAAGAI